MSQLGDRIAVLYNPPTLPPGHPDYASEADVVEVARIVAACLTGHGLDASPLPASPPLAGVVADLARFGAVFNLIEGFAGSSAGEAARFRAGMTSLFAMCRC